MSSTPLTTQHIEGDAAFTQLADAWDALASTGMTDTPFQTLAYQKAWWAHLGSGDLHTVTASAGDALVAIGSFFILDGVLQFNASKEESDYLDLIVSAENAEAAWHAIIDTLCSSSFPQWSTLDLWNIPAASPSRAIVTKLAAERGFSIAEERAEVCPVITLPATFDEYLAGIDKKQRHEIKRKLRRAKGAEAVLIEVSDPDTLEQSITDFLALLQSSTIEKGEWLTPGRTAVFQAVSAEALAAGTLQLLFLEVDGEKAAALYNFTYKGRTWVYNSGLNPMAFRNLSSGVVLSALAIEKAIELGNTSFDFLRGDEQYKYRFGAVDEEIFRITLKRE